MEVEFLVAYPNHTWSTITLEVPTTCEEYRLFQGEDPFEAIWLDYIKSTWRGPEVVLFAIYHIPSQQEDKRLVEDESTNQS